MRPKGFTIYLDDDLHGKLRYIAKYDGRTMAGEIRHLIRMLIARFELEHGEITLE